MGICQSIIGEWMGAWGGAELCTMLLVSSTVEVMWLYNRFDYSPQSMMATRPKGEGDTDFHSLKSFHTVLLASKTERVFLKNRHENGSEE